MKEDGTINRAALPAIFNPEDLNALEQALQLKEQNPGSTITLLTMGPPRAAEIIREGLFRGADGGIVLTDRAFAGADTLATSYALSCAVRKIKDYDIILGGRQAIDGDTAQVGPQIAEKLGIPQVTYAEQILNIENVITVNGSADECRPRNAKLIQRYKYAKTPSEKQGLSEECLKLYEQRPALNLYEWSVNDVDADLDQVGLAGSPTKVKAVQNVVFQAKESKQLTAADNEIEDLVKELIANHTIG